MPGDGQCQMKGTIVVRAGNRCFQESSPLANHYSFFKVLELCGYKISSCVAVQMLCDFCLCAEKAPYDILYGSTKISSHFPLIVTSPSSL